MAKKKAKPIQSQIDKFVEVARTLGCDESEAAFDVKLKKLTTPQKPAKEKKQYK